MKNSLISKCLAISMSSLIILASCNNEEKKIKNSSFDEILRGKWVDSVDNFQILIDKNEVTKITSDTVKLPVEEVETIKKNDCIGCKSLIVKIIYEDRGMSSDILTLYNFKPNGNETIQFQTGGETRFLKKK